MTFPLVLRRCLVAAPILLAGCASHPAPTTVLAERLTAYGLSWRPVDAVHHNAVEKAADRPGSGSEAVQMALQHSPVVHQVLARLQLAQAAHLEAISWRSRLSLSRLVSQDPAAASAELAASLSLGLSDLLLLPQRRRLADDSLLVAQGLQLQHLLDHLQQVEAGWWIWMAAQARRDVLAEVVQVASVSARLAQAYADAGNLSRRQRLQQQLMLSQSTLALQQAEEQCRQQQLALQALIGLPSTAAWVLPTIAWPQPPALTASEDWLAQALSRRPDARARVQGLSVTAARAGLSRWTSPLAEVDVGYAWTRETDGSRQRGPTLSLPLPWLGPARAQRWRASAEHALAEADWQQWRLQLQHDLMLAEARLAGAAQRLQQADQLLNEQRALLAEDQRALNFMLTDVFAVLVSRRQLAEAELARIDALRDYWLQHSRLTWASGGAFAAATLPETSEQQRPAPEDPMPPHSPHHHSH